MKPSEPLCLPHRAPPEPLFTRRGGEPERAVFDVGTAFRAAENGNGRKPKAATLPC